MNAPKSPSPARGPSDVRFARLMRALDDIRAGKMVILVDDEDRENEGDLCMAASAITPETVNFMAREGRGLICVTLTEERIRELGFSMMVSENQTPHGTAFTVSVDAREGISTGISAADRARTIALCVDPEAGPADFVVPGHVFPLRARRGGVLQRAGQTEGSVDLARLAGLDPAGVICEIMNDDGSMSRMPDLEVFAERHGLVIVTIAELIEYRLERESLVTRVNAESVKTAAWGDFELSSFESSIDGARHLVLSKGPIDDQPTLVRVHRECRVGDVFGASVCDCGPLLHGALDAIAHEGRGVVLYLAAGRDRHGFQSGPPKTGSDMSMRDFGTGAQILAALGLRRIRLLTNRPARLPALDGYGLQVTELVPIAVSADRSVAPLLAFTSPPTR